MSVVVNRVRQGFYLDSVALMRLSGEIMALDGVLQAALMIGTPSNQGILDDAGLLTEDGAGAGPNDLILALEAASETAADTALGRAGALLDSGYRSAGEAGTWRPKSLATALDALPGADLALISVPGEFAAAEARKALDRGLHVMIFSDNVALADERALKERARDRGLLLMGPDCGTALIGGVPLAFANAVPQGDVGIVAASGTGLQEVSCLIARSGGGVSHGIGVGGRDLSEAIGGIMILAALDALDGDPTTKRIVLISKPPAAPVARTVLERIGRLTKPVTVCFLGATQTLDLPANATQATTLAAAAGWPFGEAPEVSISLEAGRHRIHGLFVGGSLCAEAQAMLRDGGEAVSSNAPIPGASPISGGGHAMIDLGADEYTQGRPHPMIEPMVRDAPLAKALADPDLAVLLLDLVIGHGAHEDPAGAVAAVLSAAPGSRPAVVASVCGTDEDPQNRAAQVRALAAAGVLVMDSNAESARMALAIIRRGAAR